MEAKINSGRSLTSGKVLARNTIWNLLGQGAPLLVAVFSIPVLVSRLGTDRFGILSLAWVVIGYFSLFDLGLGRALTKLVAEKIGVESELEIAPLIWTTVIIMVMLGLAWTVLMFFISPWVVGSALKVPNELKPETLNAFYLLAISGPIIVSTTGLRGVLEAQQRFGLANAVRIPMGVATFLGPLVVLPFSQNIFPIVGVLLVTRIAAWLAYLVLCLYSTPVLRHTFSVSRRIMGPVLRLSTWIAISNFIGPIMAYFDRFLVGAVLSMTAVAYYATPYDLVSNLGVIPAAIAGVLFPAFAASFATDSGRTSKLYQIGLKYNFLILFPLTLIIVVFSRKGLSLWLGSDFAASSFRVLQLLAVGRLIICMAQIPLALLQGIGRPDLTAKLNMIELPFFLVASWWAIKSYSIEGAALAWVARAGFETLMLFWLANRLVPMQKQALRKSWVTALASLTILSLLFLPMSPVIKVIYTTAALVGFSIFTLSYLDDVGNIKSLISSFRGPAAVAREAEQD